MQFSFISVIAYTLFNFIKIKTIYNIKRRKITIYYLKYSNNAINILFLLFFTNYINKCFKMHFGIIYIIYIIIIANCYK